jgi:ketol-acid reductoisomerase
MIMHKDWQPPRGRPLLATEAPHEVLADRRVAVVGYGTMGRAHALNLHDSGIEVVVGARDGSSRAVLAHDEGLTVRSPAEAAAGADIVMLMLPDQAMKAVFEQDIRPVLRPQAAIGFAHGFAVAFDQIDPGERACFLVAPKAQGDKLREAYLAGGGAPGLLAVTPGSPPGTWALAAAYAAHVGCLQGGGWRTTFRDECVADQFGEQVVLCGGVIELLRAAFDTLTERGYDPTNAYYECVHELALISDLLQRYGLTGMRRRISTTAAYGGLTRGPRVLDSGLRVRLAAILDEIEDGTFAREFLSSQGDSKRGTGALIDAEASAPLARMDRTLEESLAAASAAASSSGPSALAQVDRTQEQAPCPKPPDTPAAPQEESR